MTLYSMAIKINMTQKDQKVLNRTLEATGYRPQRRKFHCTIGFIEKMIPSEEALSFGQSITHDLQEAIASEPFLYEVEKAVHLFGHVLAFVPTNRSQDNIKKINLWLFHRVHEISEGRWELNRESIPENYTPHLTLWHTHHPDHRFKKLQEFAETHPTYRLEETGYVIFI
jgi:2'-5' RNA ligase